MRLNIHNVVIGITAAIVASQVAASPIARAYGTMASSQSGGHGKVIEQLAFRATADELLDDVAKETLNAGKTSAEESSVSDSLLIRPDHASGGSDPVTDAPAPLESIVDSAISSKMHATPQGVRLGPSRVATPRARSRFLWSKIRELSKELRRYNEAPPTKMQLKWRRQKERRKAREEAEMEAARLGDPDVPDPQTQRDKAGQRRSKKIYTEEEAQRKKERKRQYDKARWDRIRAEQDALEPLIAKHIDGLVPPHGSSSSLQRVKGSEEPFTEEEAQRMKERKRQYDKARWDRIRAEQKSLEPLIAKPVDGLVPPRGSSSSLQRVKSSKEPFTEEEAHQRRKELKRQHDKARWERIKAEQKALGPLIAEHVDGIVQQPLASSPSQQRTT